MKYFIAFITFFIFFNYSCKKSESKTTNSEIALNNKDNNHITNDLKQDNTPACKVTIQDRNIILNCDNKQTVYKDLIINEMSVSTEFIQEKGNSFSLLYDLNASDTKIKEKYVFVYSQKGLTLAYKEVIKFGREGVSLNKLYFNHYAMNGKTYEDIQSLGSDIHDNFNTSAPVNFLYDSQKRIFAKETYRSTPEDLYINYPKVAKPSLEITNIETANNQAYALQQIGENYSSHALLEEIIKKSPERVVAYLNLADSYWDLNDKNKAKETYQKYISLMKSQKKEVSKIPERAYQRSK
ncbi:tetratricopeptide repeat protein [Chryseobacterium camelliae]|uniref:Tetratricopeptide repeat protein n=1 Tax=Chryseobacterium camelliae TaxID=1265445 RepID=A0ABY7QL22_9FLAO|nr:tetratricopeptide repeat protein [Chryseobacterium camelliae]WBV59849.1 tetratricopeptide repeat protein [Chryseobacterium camelliae]